MRCRTRDFFKTKCLNSTPHHSYVPICWNRRFLFRFPKEHFKNQRFLSLAEPNQDKISGYRLWRLRKCPKKSSLLFYFSVFAQIRIKDKFTNSSIRINQFLKATRPAPRRPKTQNIPHATSQSKLVTLETSLPS